MLKDTKAFSSFSVDDLGKAKEFYGQTLGLETTDDPMGLRLVLAGGAEVFIYPKDTHTPATFTVLNFVVDDITEAVEDLNGRGIKMAHYEGMHQDEKGIERGLAAKQGPDIAWFTDPAGNVLSVMQVK